MIFIIMFYNILVLVKAGLQINEEKSDENITMGDGYISKKLNMDNLSSNYNNAAPIENKEQFNRNLNIGQINQPGTAHTTSKNICDKPLPSITTLVCPKIGDKSSLSKNSSVFKVENESDFDERRNLDQIFTNKKYKLKQVYNKIFRNINILIENEIRLIFYPECIKPGILRKRFCIKKSDHCDLEIGNSDKIVFRCAKKDCENLQLILKEFDNFPIKKRTILNFKYGSYFNQRMKPQEKYEMETLNREILDKIYDKTPNKIKERRIKYLAGKNFGFITPNELPLTNKDKRIIIYKTTKDILNYMKEIASDDFLNHHFPEFSLIHDLFIENIKNQTILNIKWGVGRYILKYMAARIEVFKNCFYCEKTSNEQIQKEILRIRIIDIVNLLYFLNVRKPYLFGYVIKSISFYFLNLNGEYLFEQQLNDYKTVFGYAGRSLMENLNQNLKDGIAIRNYIFE